MDEQKTGPILIACAVAAEARAVARGLGATLPDDAPMWEPVRLSEDAHVLITGVGKANAGGAVARAIALESFRAVWSAGVAGALPGSGLSIGETVLATSCVFADEGVDTPAGFLSIAEVGFPTTQGVAADQLNDTGGLLTRGAPGTPIASRVTARGPIGTVSLGAGTDSRAAGVATRTGALCEAMEGAAVALTGARMGVPFDEIRAISNNTGDREHQKWDLRAALDALSVLFDGAL